MNNRTVILTIVGVAIAAIIAIFIFMNRPSGEPGDADVSIPVSARITIIDPANGTVLDNGASFTVRGTGEGLPEGNVVVEALDSAGNVLAVQPTTVTASDAGTGGAGPWSVQLTAQVPPGTPGSIRAYAQSPADGSLLAETAVTVAYGIAPSPVQAEISIEIPQQAEIIGSQEVVVVGQGTALPENNVVVQALSSDGLILAEAATTVNADLGSTGEWRATLRYSVAPGTPGQIVASSTSPADGTVVAIASVDVQYDTAPQPEPAITIANPLPGTVVDPGQITVEGTGTALPENNVVVRAMEANGNLLAEQPTAVNAELGGSGPWSIVFSVAAAGGSPGVIQAYAVSPADGSILAMSEVNVVYGDAVPSQPAISIESPTSGETVNPEEIVVRGSGTALPENNVVVRVLDNNNNVLAEAPTTVDAELGGTGPWSATISVEAGDSSSGQIVAFSASPADGSTVAQGVVDIVFGRVRD